jgi:ligand-binding SRPBCC domain-containing protein
VKTWTLERQQTIPRPRSEVFAFFEDAANLGRITPPFLRFRIATPPPIAMGVGTLIDYRIALFGVPMRWRTRIDVYEPQVRFVDTQLRGPYRLWRHTHEFRDEPGGTLIIDRVEYALGFGFAGSIARALFVRRTLERIFDYRSATVSAIFAADADTPARSADADAASEARA